MTQGDKIYEGRAFWRPTFEVRLGGESLDRQVVRDVISVSYTDSLDALDTCQLTLNNWDEANRRFKYSDSGLFDPGTSIEVYMGYLDDPMASGQKSPLQLMLRGTITSMQPSFPAGGQPTIQIRALNELYRLHFKQKTETYSERTDTQIARDILKSLEADMQAQASAVGKTPPRLELKTNPNQEAAEDTIPYVAVENEYPILFLMKRARRNGYDLYIEEVDDGEQTKSLLHFHPPVDGTPPAYELKWGESLVSFSPTLRTKNQVAKVKVRGWNPTQTKEPIEAEATREDLPFAPLLAAEDLAAVDGALAGSEEVVADRPIYNEREAKELAKEILANKLKDMVTASGSTVGLPKLRAGRAVYIRNLGRRFSGRYLVTSSTHTIGDGGYTTDFEARKEDRKTAKAEGEEVES
ncbi:phage late control D family protein [Persicimonas caeni]|uniref:Phage late control D family protein n=1 Tax=Persicimonas caeni TaxID=2292766 RepID=A0A4Y6PVJ4_PERCE|nr:phage late control D family protein [Persicimonas caeni]QDG52260.1 phage late control D family protein [Persicimonas caeni]QED33482.1 phage late control D family protein [Persicimonas caeni]